jgi:hypothetical protein
VHEDAIHEEIIDERDPPSTRDALLKSMTLDAEGNVRIRWKKYMDEDAPWAPNNNGKISLHRPRFSD